MDEKNLVPFEVLTKLTQDIQKEFDMILAIPPEKRIWIVAHLKTPAQFIKERIGRGEIKLTYVEGHYIKRLLNFFFPGDWEFTATNWRDGDHIICQGQLTIHFGNKTRSISGIGGAEVKYLKNKEHTPENMIDLANDYKGAETDCLKKCASAFGFASDVYAGEYKAEAPKTAKTTIPTSRWLTDKEKEYWDKMIKSHLLTQAEREQLLSLDSSQNRRMAIKHWWGENFEGGERAKREKAEPKPPTIEAIFETKEKPKKEQTLSFAKLMGEKKPHPMGEVEKAKKQSPESRVAQLLYLFVKKGIPEIPAQERFIKKTLGISKKLGELTVEEQTKVEEKLKKAFNL